jgi:hypothetical protein
MSTTTYDKEFEKAFVIEEKGLRRIGDLITQHKGHIECTAWFSDASQMTGLTLNELLALPNPSTRQIVRIDVDTLYSDPLRVRVSLKNEFYLAPVSYRVLGDNKDAIYVAGQLDKLLEQAFQPYSPFAVILGYHFFIGGILQTAGVVLLGVAVQSHKLAYGMLGAFLVVGTWLYIPVVRRIMPKGVFAIGDGVERTASLKSRRMQAFSVLFVALILGFIVSLASNWFFENIIKH